MLPPPFFLIPTYDLHVLVRFLPAQHSEKGEQGRESWRVQKSSKRDDRTMEERVAFSFAGNTFRRTSILCLSMMFHIFHLLKKHGLVKIIFYVCNCAFSRKLFFSFSSPSQDWVSSPKNLLSRISDPPYRRFALDLNSRWKTLSRRISEDVRDNPHLYSLLYLPHPVVVPGGRFREVRRPLFLIKRFFFSLPTQKNRPAYVTLLIFLFF